MSYEAHNIHSSKTPIFAGRRKHHNSAPRGKWPTLSPSLHNAAAARHHSGDIHARRYKLANAYLGDVLISVLYPTLRPWEELVYRKARKEVKRPIKNV